MLGKEQLIETFADYVKNHCQNVSVEQASAYAARGEQFLQQIAAGNAQKDQDMAAISTCILWCLLKKSYDAKMPFGKGMFNMAFADEEQTKQLYSILKTIPESYSRSSTHYNDRTNEHFGIDFYQRKDREFIQPPWNFKTICFGLCTEPDGSSSMYMKPETEGVDLWRNPISAFKHLINLILHKIRPEKLAGTTNYREDGAIRAEMKNDVIQRGNEIRFVVDAQHGANLKPLETIKTKQLVFERTLKQFAKSNISQELKDIIIQHFQHREAVISDQLKKAQNTADPKVQKTLIAQISTQVLTLQNDWLKFLNAKSEPEILAITKKYTSEQLAKNKYLHKKKSWFVTKTAVQPMPPETKNLLELGTAVERVARLKK